MAGTDPLELRYTATVQDRIASLSWLRSALRSVTPRESLRTPVPFYASPNFVGFVAGFGAMILAGSLLKALLPDPLAVFLGFMAGYIVGAVVALLGGVVAMSSAGWRDRQIERALLRANGGLHCRDRSETATLSDAGLRFESDCGARSYPWSQLSSFAEHQGRIVFGFRNGDAGWVPRACLDDDQRRKLASLLERRAPGIGPVPATPLAGQADEARTV